MLLIVTQLRLITLVISNGVVLQLRLITLVRDLDARRNLYKHPHAKYKGFYGFQGDLNPVGPKGSSYKVFIL